MTEPEFHTDAHKRLHILAGVWDTTITMLGANGEEGEVSRAIDTYTWMPNGHFLVHDVDAIMLDKSVQSIEIIGVDKTTGEFFSRSYDPDGSINDFSSRMEGLEYSIEAKAQRFSGKFSQDGKILQGQWKQLSDGKWLPFVKVVLRKRS